MTPWAVTVVYIGHGLPYRAMHYATCCSCLLYTVHLGLSPVPLSRIVCMCVCCRCLVWAVLPSLSLCSSWAVLGYWGSPTMSQDRGTFWGQSMVSCKYTGVCCMSLCMCLYAVCIGCHSLYASSVTYVCICSYLSAASWSQIWLPILGSSGISSQKCLTTSENSSFVCFKSTSSFWLSPSAFVSSKPHTRPMHHTAMSCILYTHRWHDRCYHYNIAPVQVWVLVNLICIILTSLVKLFTTLCLIQHHGKGLAR